MKITEVYKKYKVLPLLQQHLFRVAYVGKLIATNMTVELNINDIILACLLHDVGNILKFDFSVIPNAVEPEGLKYWTEVQNEFRLKYGDDEVEASHKIIKELNVSTSVTELVSAFGTRNSKLLSESKEYAKMIVNYSDHRVAPEGIKTLSERIEDQRARFYKSSQANALNTISRQKAEQIIKERKENDDAKFILEKNIFEKCMIKPEDIKDIKIKSIISGFANVEI